MSTDQRNDRRQALLALAVGVPVLAVLVVVGLLLREHGPGHMGEGMLAGAGIALIGGLLMWWRALRTGRASTFERAWTQTGDERDDSVLTHALAVLGLVTVPLTGAATVAIGFGAPVEVVLGMLMIAQIVIGGVTFVVINRRS